MNTGQGELRGPSSLARPYRTYTGGLFEWVKLLFAPEVLAILQPL